MIQVLDRPRRHGCSGSTTRTPSRWTSGSGCSRDVRRGPPRGDLPVRGVHPPAMMQHPRARSASTSRTRTSPGATPRRSSTEYLTRSPARTAPCMRPSFWPTTHDILPPYLQHGGVAAFAIRAVLAATGVAHVGHLLRLRARRERRRARASRSRSTTRSTSSSRATGRRPTRSGISTLLTRLNEIRRAHPALQQLRNLTVHPTSDDAIVCFSKHLDAEHSPTGAGRHDHRRADDRPARAARGVVDLDPRRSDLRTRPSGSALGAARAPRSRFAAHDVLSGETYAWGSTSVRPARPARVRSRTSST